MLARHKQHPEVECGSVQPLISKQGLNNLWVGIKRELKHGLRNENLIGGGGKGKGKGGGGC